MDNKAKDLHYAVRFENHVKNKNNCFLLTKSFFFKPLFFIILGKVFFMSPKNLIASALFLQRQIL